MSVNSILVLGLIGIGIIYAWTRLRSNMREIRSMQAQIAGASGSSEFDSPEPLEGPAAGHGAGHPACDAGGHHVGDCGHGFDGGHFDIGGHH